MAIGTNGATIAYTGTGVQTIANIVYNNLTINNATGISQSNDLIVNGALILSSGKLNIGTNTITLNGTFSGSATNSLKANGSSNLMIGGSGAMGGSLFFDQSTPGVSKGTGLANDLTVLSQGTTNRFNNFTLNRAASGTITLGNEMQITNAFIPTAGILASGGNLVMLSTDNTTSSILTLGTTTSITGDVNVQSFFKGGGYQSARGHRMISSPIAKVVFPNNFLKKMQERFIITGPTGTLGGFDSGGIKVPYATTFRSYVEAGAIGASSYNIPNNLSDLITIGKGYLFFFRGNRTNATTTKVNDVNLVFADPENCTATYIGTINSGNISIPVTKSSSGDGYDGYNLIGNPYPSTIDFDALVASNPVLNDNIISIIKRTKDGFITRSGGVLNYSTSPSPVAGSTTTSDDIRFIQSGQGFNVKANANGSVTFMESHKVTSAQNASSARVLSSEENGALSFGSVVRANVQSSIPRQLIRLNVEDAVNQDAATVVLEPGNNATYGGNDATYFTGSTVFCSTLTSDTVKTAINFMPQVNEVKEIKIYVSSAESNPDLKLNFTELTAIEGKLAWLYDKQKNIFTKIDATHKSYAFGINKDNRESFGNNRFALEFMSKEEFSIQLSGFTLSKRVYGTLLNWETISEKNSKLFEIERSDDGINFLKIGQQSAMGTSTEKKPYNFSDKNPSTTTNYYRLKMIDESGRYDYSKVVNIDHSFGTEDLVSIYPNPVVDNLNVSWKTKDNGVKQINIYDMTGKMVKALGGIKDNYLIQNVSNLQQGVYILKLLDITGKTIASAKFVKQN